MAFERWIRLGWLLLATAVLIVWCFFPRLRTIRVWVDTSGSLSIDSSNSVSVGGDNGSPVSLTIDGTSR